MATKFPKFSQALAQDPATRRIWYGIATAHDLEAHDGMTEENLYQKIFASHFGHSNNSCLSWSNLTCCESINSDLKISGHIEQ